MTTFKSAAFAAAILLGVSLSAPAAAATFSHEEVRAALENTIARVKAAISAIETGADQTAIADLVSSAKQQQKDIENNDLEVKRQQAARQLNTAWKAARGGDLPLTGESLKAALVRYEEMQKIYISSH